MFVYTGHVGSLFDRLVDKELRKEFGLPSVLQSDDYSGD
jgi:hypothetical protein